jgi:hypothetical protein
MQHRDEPWSRASSLILGLLLIGAGLVFLAVQTLGWVLPFDLGRVGWPLYIVAPGMVLLLVGLVMPEEPGAGLAIAGSIVTTTGLVLAYQASTDHFASWAYAWALVAPASVGAGMVLWGVLHLRGGMVRGGLATLGVGLVLFLVGFGFFEGVLNIGGERGLAPLGRQALPVALIVAGGAIIITRLWPRPRREWHATWSSPPPGDAPGSPTSDAPRPVSDQPPGS